MAKISARGLGKAARGKGKKVADAAASTKMGGRAYAAKRGFKGGYTKGRKTAGGVFGKGTTGYGAGRAGATAGRKTKAAVTKGRAGVAKGRATAAKHPTAIKRAKRGAAGAGVAGAGGAAYGASRRRKKR